MAKGYGRMRGRRRYRAKKQFHVNAWNTCSFSNCWTIIYEFYHLYACRWILLSVSLLRRIHDFECLFYLFIHGFDVYHTSNWPHQTLSSGFGSPNTLHDSYLRSRLHAWRQENLLIKEELGWSEDNKRRQIKTDERRNI